MPLSAVIVDDEQLARDELAFLLKSVDDVNVVAQGKNGVEAINLIRELWGLVQCRHCEKWSRSTGFVLRTSI